MQAVFCAFLTLLFLFSSVEIRLTKKFYFLQIFLSQNRHDIRLYSIKYFNVSKEADLMTRAYLATAAAVLAVALAVFSVASVLPV